MKIRDIVSELESDESLKKQGNLVYIKETDKYYTYNKDNEWQEAKLNNNTTLDVFFGWKNVNSTTAVDVKSNVTAVNTNKNIINTLNFT